MDDIQLSQQAVDFVITQANAQVVNCPGCNLPVAGCHCCAK